MKNVTLQKKLQSYAALASVMTVPAAASGQIIYTDLDPDVEITAGTLYEMDLNNDGIVDFRFDVGSNPGVWTKGEVYVSSSQDMNAVDATIGSLGYYYPRVLATSDPIDENNSWLAPIPYATFVIAYASGAAYGNWGGADNGYMGIRFDIDGNLHYGWVRLDVAADGSSMTLKDFAYEATAEMGIAAGAMPVGVTNLHQPIEAKIFAAPNKLLTIQLGQSLTHPVLSIYNIVGQKIMQKEIETGTFQEDLSAWATGNYLVNISAKEGTITRKIPLR